MSTGQTGAAGEVFNLRTFTPIFNADKCRRCGLCENYCPEVACMLTDDGVIFDYRFCKGCGICANECQIKAIEMVRTTEIEK